MVRVAVTVPPGARRRDAVRLAAGGRARRKVVEVSGLAAPEVDRRLAEASGP